MVAIVLVVVWYVWPHFKDIVPRGLRLWAQAGFAFTLFIPKYLYDLYHPPVFDVVVDGRMVTYQFRSPWYAALFTGYNLNEVTRVNPGYTLTGNTYTTEEGETP